MRDFAQFTLLSPLHAICVVGIFGLISLHILPFALLSSAALALMVLRHGLWQGSLVALGAGTVIMAVWLGSEPKPGIEYPLVFALWLPTWLAGSGLRHGLGQATVVMSLTVYCMAYALFMHLYTGDAIGFWLNWLRHAIAGVPGAHIQGFERDGTLQLMNGLVAVLYALSLIFSLLIARWLQSLIFNPGGFGPEFQTLRLPVLFLISVATACVSASYFLYSLMLDWLMVITACYFIAGLSILHAVVTQRGLNTHWLIPPYAALLILPQHTVLGLAVVGMIDSFVDFRRRAS
ncbi:MAG: hypothetical protein ACR2HF_03900 [Methylococcaceae bacterium]